MNPSLGSDTTETNDCECDCNVSLFFYNLLLLIFGRLLKLSITFDTRFYDVANWITTLSDLVLHTVSIRWNRLIFWSIITSLIMLITSPLKTRLCKKFHLYKSSKRTEKISLLALVDYIVFMETRAPECYIGKTILY